MTPKDIRTGFVVFGIICVGPSVIEKYADSIALFLSQDVMGIFVFPLFFILLRKFKVV